MRIIILLATVVLTACASAPPDSANRVSYATPGVVAIAQAEGGVVDTDKYTNVRCERLRIVGTHMVERICFTQEEQDAVIKETQAEYYEHFGAGNKCLSRGRCRGN